MKAVILAAGIGKRLRPLTEAYAKAMVQVKGRPVLELLVENLKACGIREFIIVIGHLGHQIREHFGDGSRFGVRMQYVVQQEQLGTAHALLQAEPLLSADDAELLVVFGDNVLDQKAIAKVLGVQAGCGVLSVVQVEDPRRFGVVEPDGRRVRSVIEKPLHPVSNLAISGVHRLPRKIFDAIRRIEKSERGEYELPHAYRMLIAEGFPFEWVDIGGFIDIGTKEDLERANQ